MTTPESPTMSNATPSGSDKVLIGYWASWGGLPVSKIPAQKFTHIIYAFSDLSDQGQCVEMDTNTAQNMIAFKQLKQQYPHLKVLVAVGGWGNSQHFSANVRTPAQRQKVVQSCVDFWIRGLTLAGPGIVDGIDIDWEYPGAAGLTANFLAEDKANFVALMQEFRTALDAQGKADGQHYLLTSAFATDAHHINVGYDLPQLAKLLDYFNLMTYDFHGTWETKGPTDFHANLYRDPDRPSLNSMDSGASLFLENGVPADKIVVGVPFYGSGWTGVDSATNHNGLYQPATGTIQAVYKDILANYESSPAYTKFRDETTHAPYLFSPSTGTFIGYDDPQSAYEKGQYALNKGLAGAMIWEISQDDSSFNLTSSIRRGLGIVD